MGYSHIWLQHFEMAQNREQVLWQKGVEDGSPILDDGSTNLMLQPPVGDAGPPTIERLNGEDQ